MPPVATLSPTRDSIISYAPKFAETVFYNMPTRRRLAHDFCAATTILTGEDVSARSSSAIGQRIGQVSPMAGGGDCDAAVMRRFAQIMVIADASCRRPAPTLLHLASLLIAGRGKEGRDADAPFRRSPTGEMPFDIALHAYATISIRHYQQGRQSRRLCYAASPIFLLLLRAEALRRMLEAPSTPRRADCAIYAPPPIGPRFLGDHAAESAVEAPWRRTAARAAAAGRRTPSAERGGYGRRACLHDAALPRRLGLLASVSSEAIGIKRLLGVWLVDGTRAACLR